MQTYNVDPGKSAANVIVLPSDDMERTKAFYERLGFAFQKEQHGKGPEHYAAEQGGSVLEIYPKPAAPKAAPDQYIRIGIDLKRDFDAVVREAIALTGGKPLEPTYTGITTVRDPDGRAILLIEGNAAKSIASMNPSGFVLMAVNKDEQRSFQRADRHDRSKPFMSSSSSTPAPVAPQSTNAAEYLKAAQTAMDRAATSHEQKIAEIQAAMYLFAVLEADPDNAEAKRLLALPQYRGFTPENAKKEYHDRIRESAHTARPGGPSFRDPKTGTIFRPIKPPAGAPLKAESDIKGRPMNAPATMEQNAAARMHGTPDAPRHLLHYKASGDREAAKAILADKRQRDAVLATVLASEENREFFLPLLPSDVLAALYSTNISVRATVKRVQKQLGANVSNTGTVQPLSKDAAAPEPAPQSAPQSEPLDIVAADEQHYANLNRLETGVVQIEGETRGVYLRGTYAMTRALHLNNVINRLYGDADKTKLPLHERVELSALTSLRDLLLGVDEDNTVNGVQHLKSYEEVKA
jgi:lactoylglutathione lyase